LEASEPTPDARGTDRRPRFFISYSRRAPDDGALADFLHQGLEAAGHEVFIDRGMQLGTDWVDEITRKIAWCDFLVVLLSSESVHSEMMLGEVRMAHRRRRRDGRPQVLPIRVRYDGPLDYELDSYLARVQYVHWGDAADSPRVLNEVVTVAAPGERRRAAYMPSALHRPPTQDDPGRPSPGEDLRTLYPSPGGTIKLSDEFYVRRRADDLSEAAARRAGETLAIKAPRQFGKSSLLIKYLAKCSEAQKRFAFVDFQSLTDAQLDNYAVLLTEPAKHLARRFRLALTETPKIHDQSELSIFVEDMIISQLNQPITLAFDEVDRILGRSYQSDFFSMLRLWHNRRAEPSSPWEQVDLALVIATEPYLLIDSKHHSPFNVAIPIEPQPFDRSSLEDLNGRYKSGLGSTELDDLHELLAGHPFLTRLAFYRLVTGQSPSFEALYTAAAEPGGPFGDHLRAMLVLLRHQEKLLAAMRQVIANGSVPDDEIYYRLHGAGLVQRVGRRVKPANLLYARFFKGLG
jgi:hypothetical protein